MRNPRSKLKRRRWLRWAGILILIFVLIQVVRSFIPDEEKQARVVLHHAVKQAFPKAVKTLEPFYGIHPYSGSTAAGSPAGKTAILIHGLDDPGLVWRNLAPALADNGWQVFIMTYPNDQAIRESSRFFLEQLQNFAKQKAGDISIVSHSMGGLVTRDLLTNPEFDYPGKAEQGLLPHIRRFIMVAPPNHGSHLARFRFLTEIRDQVYHLLYTDSHLLRCLLDGTGAAGIDLLPKSRFLIELNRRPLPRDIDIRIIAGILIPWFPESTIVRTLGDGLVPVFSAELTDLPVSLVHGIHMPMIRNFFENSTRIPPAVPKVLEILEAVPARGGNL